MEVNYNKLWKLLIDKGITRTELKDKCKMSTVTLARMGKNQSVNINTILRICEVLGCDFCDIMEFNK